MSQAAQAPGYQIGQYRWRIWSASVAVCAWAGLALQTFLVIERVGSVALAIWRLSIFFTILSNFTVAVIYTGIALGSQRLRHPLIIAGLALTMALVGAVFELMLRRILHLSGWRYVTNALLHDAVPILSVWAWLVLAEKGRLRYRDPWLIAIFPIVYLFYALIRGATGGFYPYPFIDPGKIGWLGVTAYVIGISTVFLLVGHGMVLLDGWLARRTAKAT